MHKTLTPLKRSFWIIFLILFTGCSPATPSAVNSNTIITQAAATAFVQLTQIAASQPTATITPTVLPTETPAPSPTQTLLPLVAVDGLRMAYIIDGNLYVQDSGKQPVQLTNSGVDRSPLFSDDGQKIVFYRGKASDPNNVYSINADGSQEQALVTDSMLTAIGLGYDELTELRDLAFVPGTHQLLFNTREFARIDDTHPSGGIPNQDLLLVDTDSAKVKRLQAPGQVSFFQVSPNGKLVWVLAGDHLDVIGLDGKTRRRLTVYPPVSPDTYIAMPNMYWTQNATKLSLVLPPATTAFGYTGPELRIIWQYSLDGSPPHEIHLNPPPVGISFSISPDGNWAVYTYFYYPGKTDEAVISGIYLGNLGDGSSKLLNVAGLYQLPTSFYWSPDSAHFIFDDDRGQMYLGNIHGEIARLTKGQFHRWVDASRYLYGRVAMGEIDKEEKVEVMQLPTGIEYFTFVFFNAQ